MSKTQIGQAKLGMRKTPTTTIFTLNCVRERAFNSKLLLQLLSANNTAIELN